MNSDTCVICGCAVPEGRQVCPNCEVKGPKELLQVAKRKPLLKFTIPLPPITKKNSQRIIINRKTNKPMIIPSKQYKQYSKDCGYFIKRPRRPIDVPVNVKAIYYMPNKRKADITNLHEALHDILVEYGVLKDDNYNIIAATDGSRVKIDRKNPRTEVEITEVIE